MTTLTGYVASPALYREVGIEAQPGDQVEIYLDQVKVPGFPEFIVGTIQNPVTVVCGGTSYPIEYDEADLAGSGVEFIENDDVDTVIVVSEARVLFTAEAAAREAAEDVLRADYGPTPVHIRQSSPLNVTGTALTDSSLSITGLLPGVWEIDLYIVMTCSSSTPSMKYKLLTTAETNALTDVIVIHAAGYPALSSAFFADTLNNVITLPDGTESFYARVSATIEFTGEGNIIFQIAQKTSNVNPVTLGPSSYMTARWRKSLTD